MSKASNNSLLGSGKTVEEEKVIGAAGPIKLYRKDYTKGREYEGIETIEMMKRKGWREQPFVVVEKPEEKKEPVVVKKVEPKKVVITKTTVKK